MSYTLIAYSQSITSTAMAARNAVADPTVRVQTVDVLVPNGFGFLKGVYAQGPDIAQAQLQSPSLRRRYPFDVRPVDTGATPAGPLIPFVDLWDHPIDLDEGEQLEAFLANAAAGANIVRSVIFLGDGHDEIPAGEIFTIRMTGTTTLVAETWTNCAMTLSNQLPSGLYAVVGGRFESATGVAARLVFPGPVYQRPGAICVNTATEVDLTRFRYGRAGEWGRFQWTTPPTVDFLATAGDTAQTVHLDLVRIGQ